MAGIIGDGMPGVLDLVGDGTTGDGMLDGVGTLDGMPDGVGTLDGVPDLDGVIHTGLVEASGVLLISITDLDFMAEIE